MSFDIFICRFAVQGCTLMFAQVTCVSNAGTAVGKNSANNPHRSKNKKTKPNGVGHLGARLHLAANSRKRAHLTF